MENLKLPLPILILEYESHALLLPVLDISAYINNPISGTLITPWKMVFHIGWTSIVTVIKYLSLKLSVEKLASIYLQFSFLDRDLTEFGHVFITMFWSYRKEAWQGSSIIGNALSYFLYCSFKEKILSFYIKCFKDQMFWAREVLLNQAWPCCHPNKIYPD